MRFHFRGGITNHQYVRADRRELARRLRRDSTHAEAVAWDLIRARRMLGLKFRRQQVIDGFIVDFFCAEHGIALEIDGEIHDDPETAAHDRERALALGRRGLKVVRVKNEAVSKVQLEQLLRPLIPMPPPLPEGEGEGGEV